MAQTRLGVRPTLLAELRDALSRTEEPTQFLNVQPGGRMPTVPRELRAASLHAIARHLDGDRSAAELAVALTVLMLWRSSDSTCANGSSGSASKCPWSMASRER